MLLKNCKLVESGELMDILIEDGKIAKIQKNITYNSDVIDIKNKYVLPGMIDGHVHMRDPGLTHKEDLFTGSCAAVKGGVTTFIDMPNTIPPAFTNKLIDEKKVIAKSKCLVNYGFHIGGSSKDNSEEIKKAKNVASTKIYLNFSTGNLLVTDKEVLKNIFTASHKVTTHSEEDVMDIAIEIAKQTGKSLYITHLSLAEEIETVARAKDKGQEIYCEITPHHLTFTEDDVTDGFLKMIPSLKTRHDRDALWQAISDGIIDTVGTDHAPHTIEEKKKDPYPFGVPGIEFALPILLNAVNEKRMTLKKAVELYSSNPAKIWGIRDKGKVEEGFDADLTVVDMDKVQEVKNTDVISKCGWTPYNGLTLKGWPVMTIVNGNIVYDNGRIHNNSRGKEVVFDG